MDNDIVNVATSIIGQLGFPIFVAVFMLIKGSKDNEKITVALNELKEAILLLNSKINDK